MKKKDLLQAFYLAFLYKFKLKETSKIIKQMPKWLAGLSEQKIINFTNKMFKDVLVHTIRPKMYEELQTHKQQNAKLVILSATFNYVCNPVAEHLQMDDIICSKLEVVNGEFTGNSLGRLCFDNEKLSRIEEYCIENNYSLENAYYYADSMADLPVLNIVGHPRCINPDKKLARVAKKNNWPVHFW